MIFMSLECEIEEISLSGRGNGRNLSESFEGRNLLSVISRRILVGSGLIENSFADEKAEEYILKRPRARIGFQGLGEIFKFYEGVKKMGRKVTTKDFFKKFGRPNSKVARIFSTVGIRDVTRKYVRNEISPEKEYLAENATSVNYFSIRDISKFIGVSKGKINYEFSCRGLRAPHGLVRRFGRGEEKCFVGYHTLSEIYEAQDLGFSEREIVQLLDLNSDAVKYALNRRGMFEERITEDLRALFMNNKIDKPYVWKD